MTELDPDAKALFEVARAALDPPRDAEARIFLKLGAAAGVSAATLATATSAASQPAAAALLGKLSSTALWLLPKTHGLPIALLALGGTVVGVGVGVRHLHPAAAPQIASTMTAVASRVVPARPRAFAATSPLPAPAALSAAPPLAAAEIAPNITAPVAPNGVAQRAVAPVIVSPGRAPQLAPDSAPHAVASASTSPVEPEPHVVPQSVATRDTHTEAEIGLMREMQSAWRSGQDSSLASAIAEHRARFPRGMLSEEREALSAMLECRHSPARAASIGARFSARFPRSPYEARVNGACRLGRNEEK